MRVISSKKVNSSVSDSSMSVPLFFGFIKVRNSSYTVGCHNRVMIIHVCILVGILNCVCARARAPCTIPAPWVSGVLSVLMSAVRLYVQDKAGGGGA